MEFVLAVSVSLAWPLAILVVVIVLKREFDKED
jgi:hypothetical protein